jgi:putative transposase
VRKAYKYRIYPHKESKYRIDRTIETCRRLYNRLLFQRLAFMDNRYQEAYGYVANHPHLFSCEEERIANSTPPFVSRYDQQKFIKEWKKTDDYLAGVYANSLISVAIKVDNVVKAFFGRCKKKKKGLIDNAGFPKFKGRAFYNSFVYESGRGFKLEGNQLSLSKIGTAKIILHRALEGTIKTCTIKRECNEYYAIFSVECEQEKRGLTGKSVGIDLGITNFIATSDGKFEAGLKVYRNAEWLISHLQKLQANKKRGSRKYKELARIISKQHLKVKRQRLYIIQNIVSRLLDKYDIVCHEDLQVKNMMQNKHLSKSISDSAWGIFINELTKKASMIEGKQIIGVDPKNTSQKCCRCGTIVKKDLSVRWHSCPECGLEIDRDVNAAISLVLKGLLQAIGDGDGY